MKPFLYLATSLTHVQELDRPAIAQLVVDLSQKTKFLQWAFDPVAWKPRKVDNIFAFDTAMVSFADFVAGVYWSSAGSDGRGAELYARVRDMGNKGLVIYIKEGVIVTPFITDMAQGFNVLVRIFKNVDELGAMILNDSFGSLQEELWPVGQYNRQRAIEALNAGYCEKLTSHQATLDLVRIIGCDKDDSAVEMLLV